MRTTETVHVQWGQLSYLPWEGDDYRVLTDGLPPVKVSVMWFATVLTWKCEEHGAHHHPARAIYMFSKN